MTCLNQHPEYRASGVDWLGDIPSHWEMVKLKNGFDLQKRPATKSAGIVTAFRDGQVTLRSNRRVDGYTEGDKQIGYQTIYPGDLVIHAMDAFAGAIGVSDSHGQSTPVYSACTPKPGFNAYFYARALRHIALTGYITSLAKGVRERSTDFRWADAKELPVPKPPVEEQEAIVAFLDRETAQIDDLIGRQERLIELLAEKRQAIITHAVTKGLDPAAPTKPSGIPWLGGVPEHWSLPRLKNCCQIRRGRFMHRPRNAPHLYGGEYPFIQTGAIARAQGKHVTEYTQTLSEAGLATSAMMPEGTLVMAIAANIGDVAILSFDSCAPDSVLGFQPTAQTNTDFLYYALTAKREELTSEAPVTSQGNLNVERVGSVIVPLPPVEEQIEIVKRLDDRLAHMSHMTTKASAMKRLLLERRSALISAAVTGKIDVREGAA